MAATATECLDSRSVVLAMSRSRASTPKTYTEAELARLFATYFGDKLSQSQLDSLITTVAVAHANRNSRRKRSFSFHDGGVRVVLLARRLRRCLAQWRSQIGLQQRIMVYVTLGLLLIFGSVAFVGLQSIRQATALVYQERLMLAYTK